MPAPGDYFIAETNGCIAPDRVMFLGTVPLHEFDYATVESWSRRAAQILVHEDLPIRHVTTTNHGVNLGLDPCEALQNLVLGVMAASCDKGLGMLQKVTIVEWDRRRAELLTKCLLQNERDWFKAATSSASVHQNVTARPPRSSDAAFISKPAVSPTKGHVFVAMPFSEEFEDVYEFGIYAPVRQHGYACENVGEAAFTGDILERIRVRIETARFMIADLSNGRPNVYLEVGYAWGRDIPTIIIAREGEQLHFDVSRHRCIFYRNIRHLAKELTQLIDRLSRDRPGAREL
jgi:hypothetical protein